MDNLGHTPTPWHGEYDTVFSGIRGEDGTFVAGTHTGDGNTEFIVRACNSHDALVEVLSMYVADCEAITKVVATPITINEGIYTAAKAALAKAKETL